MPIYKFYKNALDLIKEKPFKLEKEIQSIVETNLEYLFNLQLVKNEFQLGGFRIDTLAYDKEQKSFVIIEYKKRTNYSVIDQGMSYLALMLNNKADFILEFNEHCGESLKRDDVDWSQSKVIFISPTFTQYQLESINYKDLPIELWEVKRYSNKTILFDQHKPTSTTASFKTVSKKSETIQKISREVKRYTEEEHLKIAKPEIAELYYRFKDLVIAINSDISIKPLKLYIAFRSKTNITDVTILSKALKIAINVEKGKLDDPKQIARDVSNVGHWGNGDYQVQIDSENELEYIVSLIRQSYNINS